ncbi:hemicentin-2 [Caerostris darwini]|uniref:Hemicentin-2 n=1 Tax=Caerostris darwini TaxID=1538125 RepID=A0AAV4S9W2_9ARAC|nr:hemicentin-2 [Caerostris darwini]
MLDNFQSGDIPLEFQWLKDGQDVIQAEGVKIQSVMDSSILLISSVTSKRSGNYVCIVKNAFGSNRYTSVLAVTAPPTWKTEPKDVYTKEGESEIRNYVKHWDPSVKHHNHKLNGKKAILVPTYNLFSSGTLSFSKIDVAMQGSYTCIADNNIGTPERVFVKVRDAPVVIPFNFPLALTEGERGSAACIVRSGDIPLEFSWLKDGKDLQEINGIKIKSLTDSSVVYILSATSESSSNYTCIIRTLSEVIAIPQY